MKKGSLHLKLAKALYRLAQKQDQSAQYLVELTKLSELSKDKAFLSALDKLGQANQNQVSDVLSKVFGKELSEPVRNLLTLLVVGHQGDLLLSIKSAYQKYYFEAEGITDLHVKSSRELSSKEQKDLSESFGSNKKVHLTFSHDKNLVGGIQIYENGLLTDYSVKNQLEHLRRVLLGEHIV